MKPKPKEPMTKQNIYLPLVLKEKIENLGKMDDRSFNYMVVKAIKQVYGSS